MVFLIGTGGHAKVVYEAMIGSGLEQGEINLRDRQPSDGKGFFSGQQIHTPEVSPEIGGARFHIAIGNNTVRAELFARAKEQNADGHTVLHANSDVSPSAIIEEAVFVASAAIVAANAKIGAGAIINHGAIVDHDCTIGEFCHIAPSAVLGGNVTIGERTLIGSGAIVLPGLDIGRDVTVGAGATVTKPIGDGGKWIGTSVVS